MYCINTHLPDLFNPIICLYVSLPMAEINWKRLESQIHGIKLIGLLISRLY